MVLACGLALLGAGCVVDVPSTAGHPIAAGSACAEVAILQCGCCGDGAGRCQEQVVYSVEAGTARTSATEAECQALKAAQEAEPAHFCAGLDSPATLRLACQGFPPSVTAPDAGGGDTDTDLDANTGLDTHPD